MQVVSLVTTTHAHVCKTHLLARSHDEAQDREDDEVGRERGEAASHALHQQRRDERLLAAEAVTDEAEQHRAHHDSDVEELSGEGGQVVARADQVPLSGEKLV